MLKFLDMNESSLKWRLVETIGKAPHPRYFHTTNYLEDMFCLAIFGGRKSHKLDTQSDTSTSGFYFNDLWLFHISSLQWCNVILKESIPEERYSHISTVHKNKIMIFGGINQKGVCKKTT